MGKGLNFGARDLDILLMFLVNDQTDSAWTLPAHIELRMRGPVFGISQ
jgi:hypothetical protein